MPEEKLKLYVWDEEGTLRDHSSGMICVLSETLEQALKLIEEKDPHCMRNFDVNKYKIIDKPEAFVCWGGG